MNVTISFNVPAYAMFSWSVVLKFVGGLAQHRMKIWVSKR